MPMTRPAPPHLRTASSATRSALAPHIGARLKGRSATNVSASASASGENANDADELGMNGCTDEARGGRRYGYV
jgi:hypothetical protein